MNFIEIQRFKVDKMAGRYKKKKKQNKAKEDMSGQGRPIRIMAWIIIIAMLLGSLSLAVFM